MTPGTLTRRLCGATLLAQAMCVVFGALVAWRLAGTMGDVRAPLYLWGGVALAGLCLVAVGTMRGPAGIALGWVAQALTLLSGLVLPAMFVIAIIFGALWWLCLSQGLRMDRVTAERDAEARAASGEAPPGDRAQDRTGTAYTDDQGEVR